MEKEEKQENLKEKVGDVKEKVTEVFGNIAEKVGEKNNDNKKKVKPLVTSRVLFVSILDKLYFIGLVLAFVGTIWGWVSNKLYWFDYSNSFFYELGSWLGGFLGILVVFAIAQVAENNLVRPYIFGKFLDLHPLIIYLFLFITAQYLGVVGVIFAPAIAATVCVLIQELYIKNIN